MSDVKAVMDEEARLNSHCKLKPYLPSGFPETAFSGRGLAHTIRFVAGVAITLGGAGVLLSDLFHLMPAFG